MPEPEETSQGNSATEQGTTSPFEFDEFFGEPDPEAQEEQVRDNQPLPGESGREQLDLTTEQERILAFDLLDKLDRYEDAMQRRRRREEEIEKNYSMVPDETTSGQTAESAQMASEITMSVVDQATARLVDNVMSVKPLMRIDPIAGPARADDISEEVAKATENFLENYSKRKVNFTRILPVAIHRTAKVGTSVLYCEWDKSEERYFKYDEEGEEQEIVRLEGNVRVEIIPNRNVICWPATMLDWQREYEIVGHRAAYSHSQWRAIAKDQLELDEDQIRSVESRAPEMDEGAEARATFADDIHTGDMDESFDPVMLTELWCHTIIPGQSKARKFQVILHEESRQLLWYDYNRLHSQKHPYFPVRYKVKDDSAWGQGAGDEVLFSHSADEAMRNLEIDNMMAGAYWIYKVVAGSSADHMTDRIMPGQKVPVDTLDDFQPQKMGGEVPELYQGMEQNQFRSREASGLAPVLSGQGDPTMKSGAGTGSTLALIEQAGKKFGQVDRNIREDLSDLYMFILELVAQYAADGLIYRYANEEDAPKVQLLKYTPPRTKVSDAFHLWAQAPNAASSAESRKQNYLMVWKFLMEYLQVMKEYAIEVLQQENPAAIPRLNRQITEFMTEVSKRVVEHHDLPAIEHDVPGLPEPTEQDQVINRLQQQLQQMQQQMQQMQQRIQQAQAGGAAQPQPGAVPGGAAPGAAPPGMGVPR